MADPYLWDRQPSESAPAYEAARMYFDMGAARSCDAVARQCSKHVSLMLRWSQRHRWTERAAAYDAMLRTREAGQREAAQAAEAETWARRRAEEAEQEWEFARALMEKARMMLRFPLQTTTSEDGKTVVHPARWTLRDIPALLDCAAKLARLAAGMEQGRQTLQGPNGEPLFLPADVVAALAEIAALAAAQQVAVHAGD